MKKKYFTPEMDIIYMETVVSILAGSGELDATDQDDPNIEE